MDPTSSNKDALKLGLFSYPVLQAADILLYNTTHVPVGEDQAQHLEFTRELAIGFNHTYASISKAEPILAVPQTLLSPAKRVMSLKEPTKKMSKSDPNSRSRILITDSQEEILAKVKVALTDSIEGVSYDREKRPGVSNLIDLMYHFGGFKADTPQELAEQFANSSLRGLKEETARLIDESIAPIRDRYQELMSGDQRKLVQNAKEGATRAEDIAKETMKRVRRTMGMHW